MRYVLVTPPDDVVSLAEAKAHLRVDHDDEDGVITAFVAAATQHLDGRAGILGRAIMTQTWRLDVAGPACGRVAIDMPGVASITSVKYLVSGVETTWDSAEYRLGADGNLSFVEAADGHAWPSTDDQEDAVRVTFVAGWAVEDVPAAIKAAILVMAGDLYEHRETVAVGAAVAAIPLSVTVKALIDPYRKRSM